MVEQPRTYTVEDLLALPDDAKRRELVEGEIVEMPPSSKVNAIFAAYIIHLLWAYVLPRQLGFVTGADSGYDINAKNFFQPEAGFITRARAGGMSGVRFPAAPDLAVEIISPSETSRSVLDKARTYVTSGTRLVWAVYPQNKLVDVYRAAEDGGLHIQTLDINATLEGGDVLIDFTVKVRNLFAVLE